MKRLILTLGLLLILITTGCGAPKSEPEANAPSPFEILSADYDKLYADYIEIQVKYGVLEAQYNNLKYNYDTILDFLLTDSTFKEELETLKEQYEILSSRYSKVQEALLFVNAREDLVINKHYPSDNETEQARWDTFYEFWDNWWVEFEDNL